MILPSGVPQRSACVLIAMREYFNDPTWEDADLVAELQQRNTPDQIQARAGAYEGYSINKIPALLSAAGLFSLPLDTVYTLMGPSNLDELYIHTDQHNLRYAFPRMAKCVLTYYTNVERTKAHSLCCPLHVAYCLNANSKYDWAHIGIDPTNMRFLGVVTP